MPNRRPTFDTVIAEILERFALPTEEITDDMRLTDLGLDSVDIFEVIIALEMKHCLDVADDALCRIVTIGDLFREIEEAEDAS